MSEYPNIAHDNVRDVGDESFASISKTIATSKDMTLDILPTCKPKVRAI
jgi:hypothetical protein